MIFNLGTFSFYIRRNGTETGEELVVQCRCPHSTTIVGSKPEQDIPLGAGQIVLSTLACRRICLDKKQYRISVVLLLLPIEYVAQTLVCGNLFVGIEDSYTPVEQSG